MKPKIFSDYKIIRFDPQCLYENQVEQYDYVLNHMVKELSQEFYENMEKLYGDFRLRVMVTFEPFDGFDKEEVIDAKSLPIL